MANENQNNNQKESPTKDERLATLETENTMLKSTMRIVVEALIEACLYGHVKRPREGGLKEALVKLGNDDV